MMRWDMRVLGATLLVIGTSIGGALLVLPIATASSGLVYSSLFLILSWALMTFTGFLMLEVNLWLPDGSNMISMARATLGRGGQVVAWIFYCLLLYTLLSAYTAGGADMLQNLASMIGLKLAAWESTCLFTGLLGSVVYLGIRSVDMVNRGLMVGKLGIYGLLIVLAIPHIEPGKWITGAFSEVPSALMLMIVSFGFGSIIPSLRSYLHGDVKQLRCVLLLGTTIPLFCYLAWDSVIMSTVPAEHLIAMKDSQHAAVDLINALNHFISSDWITSAYRLFTSICVLTAFLSVSLSLVDFLADGLKMPKKGCASLWLHVGALIPPLLIVLFYPGAFLLAMTYAGIICIIFLALLPILMVWNGRYIQYLQPSAYRVFGGKIGLVIALLSTITLLVIAVLQR